MYICIYRERWICLLDTSVSFLDPPSPIRLLDIIISGIIITIIIIPSRWSMRYHAAQRCAMPMCC